MLVCGGYIPGSVDMEHTKLRGWITQLRNRIEETKWRDLDPKIRQKPEILPHRQWEKHSVGETNQDIGAAHCKWYMPDLFLHMMQVQYRHEIRELSFFDVSSSRNKKMNRCMIEVPLKISFLDSAFVRVPIFHQEGRNKFRVSLVVQRSDSNTMANTRDSIFLSDSWFALAWSTR